MATPLPAVSPLELLHVRELPEIVGIDGIDEVGADQIAALVVRRHEDLADRPAHASADQGDARGQRTLDARRLVGCPRDLLDQTDVSGLTGELDLDEALLRDVVQDEYSADLPPLAVPERSDFERVASSFAVHDEFQLAHASPITDRRGVQEAGPRTFVEIEGGDDAGQMLQCFRDRLCADLHRF